MLYNVLTDMSDFDQKFERRQKINNFLGHFGRVFLAAILLLASLIAYLVFVEFEHSGSKTNPDNHSKPAAVKFSFAVFGDSHSDSASGNTTPIAFHKIIDSIVAFSPQPSFAIGLGDNIYVQPTDTADIIQRRYDAFKVAVDKLTAKIKPLYLTPGNHEYLGMASALKAYESNFADTALYGASAKLYYSFDKGNVHFVSLCTDCDINSRQIGYVSETSPTNSKQAKWLVGDLRKNTKPFTIIFFHHPMFDLKLADSYGSTKINERDNLNKLFDKYGVDAVLQGDVHYYRRHAEPNGIVYLTQAQGGSNQMGSNADDRYSIPCNTDGHDVACYGIDNSSGAGYTIITSDGSNSLSANSYTVDIDTGTASVLDSFFVNQNPRQ